MGTKRNGRAGLFFRVFAVLALAGGIAACDNPVGEDEEHPEGLLIVNAQGATVAIFDAEEGETTGTVTVAAGATEAFKVLFVDHDGNPIPVTGGEFALGAPTVADAGVASAAIQNIDVLQVTGTAAGSTTLSIPALHAGHQEFLAAFPLTVTP